MDLEENTGHSPFPYYWNDTQCINIKIKQSSSYLQTQTQFLTICNIPRSHWSKTPLATYNIGMEWLTTVCYAQALTDLPHAWLVSIAKILAWSLRCNPIIILTSIPQLHTRVTLAAPLFNKWTEFGPSSDQFLGVAAGVLHLRQECTQIQRMGETGSTKLPAFKDHICIITIDSFSNFVSSNFSSLKGLPHILISLYK